MQPSPATPNPPQKDHRNSPALAEACRADVDAHCGGAAPGGGRVYDCLAGLADPRPWQPAGQQATPPPPGPPGPRPQLSPACAAEFERVQEIVADDVTLDAGLLRLCGAERDRFCGAVAHGEGRVFRCLAENLLAPDFGRACQDAVGGKLRRREGNWRLDPSLRRACRGDVDRWVTVRGSAVALEAPLLAIRQSGLRRCAALPHPPPPHPPNPTRAARLAPHPPGSAPPRRRAARLAP